MNSYIEHYEPLARYGRGFISIISGLVLVIVLLDVAVNVAHAKKQPARERYIMGVFPHLPPRQLEKIFAPMAADLGKTINRKIILRTNTTFKRFSKSLNDQIFDIAFVQPFDYIRIADEYGYRPLAARDEKLVAILVVKQDSTLKDIQDFRGKKIALPPAEAAVSYFIRDYLNENGIDPDKDVTLSHHRSHVSCMQQVLIGKVDACGTAAPPLRFFQHKMKVKMKIVVKSQEFPHALFVIHPRVPAEEMSIIKERIMSWSKTEEGRKLLEQGRLKPFVPISDADYDVIRMIAR